MLGVVGGWNGWGTDVVGEGVAQDVIESFLGGDIAAAESTVSKRERRRTGSGGALTPWTIRLRARLRSLCGQGQL